MLKKLNLDSTRDYEISVAAFKIAEMIVAYVEGHKHIKSIGAEQGDISKWDDLVIDEENCLIHIQIKRQTTDFSDDPCTRDQYTKGKRKGIDRDLSPFDDTLKNLADWLVNNNPSTMNPTRTFEIYLPDYATNIKSGLKINDFRILCEEYIKSTSTAAGLSELQSHQDSVNQCFQWLKTWCGFEDWDHILKALKNLKIKIVGSKSQLDENSKLFLNHKFKQSDVVLSIIKGYIGDNTTFTGAITPRPLLYLLQDYLVPEVNHWTQFNMNGSNWEISGILDLEIITEVERPSIVIPELWNADKDSSLKIVVPNNTESKLLNKVLHLALHTTGLCNCHISHHDVWKQKMKNKIGGTLGNSKYDCDNLSVVENSSTFTSSDIVNLDSIQKQDELANVIDDEIVKTTWLSVKAKLNRCISEVETSELQNAIDTRWRAWQAAFETNVNEQKELFKYMLHPKAEGEDIEGELRIGTKTTDLIVEGLFLLLVVSVALSAQDNNWKMISDDYTAKTICLAYWSGPSGKKRSVRHIEDNGIKDLIGQVDSNILVLSKVKSNEAEIFDYSIASGEYSSNSMAHSHRPKLIVTNHSRITNLIAEGKIEPLKVYFEDLIKRNKESIAKSINEAAQHEN